MLAENLFILTSGKININDFAQMRMILERYNDIGKFIANCSIKETPQYQKSDQFKRIKSELKIEHWMKEGLELFFDTFYKNRIVVKLIPFKDYPDFRFVGNLNKQFLRDNISSITYKYGTAPVSEWTIFGQIASIPPKNRPSIKPEIGGSEIEVAIQKMFDSLREVEIIAQSVVYPEISITPIAIYRD